MGISFNRFAEIAMPSIALQFPSGRGTRRSGVALAARRALQAADFALSAVVEALESLRLYHSLSVLSDAELQKRGLTRETLARFVLLGRSH
jgi:hypothetical protein